MIPPVPKPSIPVSSNLDNDTVRYRINTRREPRFDTEYLVSFKLGANITKSV